MESKVPRSVGKWRLAIGDWRLIVDRTHFATINSWLLAVGLLLTGLGAGFAPWLWRDSVALQLTAPGLAEFVKFLPEVRLGQLDLERLYFLLPLFQAMLMIPLIISNRWLALPGWPRWLLRAAVVPLALAEQRPIWPVATLRDWELRMQTVLAGMALLVALISPLFKDLPLKPLLAVWLVVGLPAMILPAWQFNLIGGALADVYRQPVSLAWGWWLAVSGIVLTAIAGAGLIFFGPTPPAVDDAAGDKF